MNRQISALALAAMMPLAANAATPEIQRAPGSPQAVGVAHTLRTIPEACARIEGKFTGTGSKSYDLNVVRTHPSCQARAKIVDAAKVNAEGNANWVLNDEVKVPNAGCSTQVATLSVWRLKVNNEPYKLDAQGRARVYLDKQAQKQWTAKDPKRVMPAYAIGLKVSGHCA